MSKTTIAKGEPPNVFFANNVDANVSVLTLIGARSISSERADRDVIGAIFGELSIEISIVANRLNCIIIGDLQLCFDGEGLIIRPLREAKVTNNKRTRQPNKESEEIESLFEEVPFT
jgi:hypothetical protein